MQNLIYNKSQEVTIGCELELQIINPQSQHLIPRAKDLIRNIRDNHYQEHIKPEITQSMIELNSSVHFTPSTMQEELTNIAYFLVEQGEQLGVRFCGSGTHPFQKWSAHKIFPSPRFKNISWQYRYLAKRFTVFALHFHIGCKNGDDAIYLTHLLSRFIPHFIVLSAASPFYQGVDTGFNSSRLNIVNAFPSSGAMPFVLSWKEFSDYYIKMKKLGIIHSMKDIYWDIRPKPNFGTVEVRVCDTPLSLQHATTIIAYAQALSLYLLKEKPQPLTQDLALVYNFNRFQACRYGYDGNFINPHTLEQHTILEDMLMTLKTIKPYATALKTEGYLRKIQSWVQEKSNGATELRQIYNKNKSYHEIVQYQCQRWLDQFYSKSFA